MNGGMKQRISQSRSFNNNLHKTTSSDNGMRRIHSKSMSTCSTAAPSRTSRSILSATRQTKRPPQHYASKIPVIQSYSELTSAMAVHASDCEEDDSSESEYETLYEPHRQSLQTPPTRSLSHKLQRRKEGLAQHTLPMDYYSEYFTMTTGVEPPSRKHSIFALLFLSLSVYLLMSLAAMKGDVVPVQQVPVQQAQGVVPPTITGTVYYYLSLTEANPTQLVAQLLQAHAFVYQRDTFGSAQLAGVCGYPTYQKEAQRATQELIEQLGLQHVLLFDICPPIEAMLQQDPHHVMLESIDFLRVDASSVTEEWRQYMESKRHDMIQPDNDHHEDQLWQHVLSLATTTSTSSSTSTTTTSDQALLQLQEQEEAPQTHRRLRGGGSTSSTSSTRESSSTDVN